VHKTNVLTFSGDLWDRTFQEVSTEYPDVETAYNHIDAACIYFVEDPTRYEVVVTDNLFGDILTDLGGAVSGGIGRASSANLNPERTAPSLFEPVHGSAPDIAGKGLANPTAAVLSGAMMLDFLGESGIADRVRMACEGVPSSGRTEEIASAIHKNLGRGQT
jgi:3-isopropylmalate dehydrogenase